MEHLHFMPAFISSGVVSIWYMTQIPYINHNHHKDKELQAYYHRVYMWAIVFAFTLMFVATNGKILFNLV